MASDLERFRDYCRTMASTSEFTPARVDDRMVCATAAERDLWTQMADEIDAHLATHYDQEQPMLGDA